MLIRKEFIEDLTMHHDDEIEKYAIGALWEHGDFLVDRIKLDYSAHEKLGYKSRKWFYTAIWNDTEFILEKCDFIKSLLSRYSWN